MNAVNRSPQYPFTQAVQYIALTLWVSIFPVASTVLAPMALTALSQGQELLNVINDQQLTQFGDHWEELLHYGLFLTALFAWALASWYGSRLLLQRDYLTPKDAEGALSTEGFRPWWNKWFPRILPAIGMTVIAAYIGIVRKQAFSGLGAAATIVVYLLFVIFRRKLFKVVAPLANRSGLSKADRIALWLSLSFSFVLLLAFAQIDWSMARFLGSPVILMLGLGSIVMLGSVVFTYLPLAYGWPAMVWLPCLGAFLLGLGSLNRNHEIAVRLIPVPMGQELTPRPSVVDDFAGWLKEHPSGPIYLVAAEGGASRSGWWTSHVLAVLDYASGGEFSKHVYAVSGVSGGSLGAATYVALLSERHRLNATVPGPTEHRFPTQEDCWDLRDNRQNYPLPVQSECFLEGDFLAPVMGYLLFPDLLQRFLPWKMTSWDRSLGLEQSWQIDWQTLFEKSSPLGSAAASNPFAQSLDALYAGRGQKSDQSADAYPIPLLFLNSTRAETGRSVLQSPVNIPSAELDDLFDSCLNTRGLPLSDAVHNSARFPVVSPGGQVETSLHRPWDALVDGGYFENSGAATLAEMIRAFDACPHQPGTKCPIDNWDEAKKRIHVIFILNTPDDSRSVLNPPDPEEQFNPGKPIKEEELMTPLDGLFNTRSARADSSKRFLMSLLPGHESQATEVFLLLHLQAPDKSAKRKREDEPAMSWYLNTDSRKAMWSAVNDEPQRDKLCQVVGLMDSVGGSQCQAAVKQILTATGEDSP